METIQAYYILWPHNNNCFRQINIWEIDNFNYLVIFRNGILLLENIELTRDFISTLYCLSNPLFQCIQQFYVALGFSAQTLRTIALFLVAVNSAWAGEGC